MTRTQIIGNRTLAQGKNGHSNGAGVSIGDGTATIDSTNIAGNTSHATGPGASAVGGGIFNDGGTVVLQRSSVVGNRPTDCDASIPKCPQTEGFSRREADSGNRSSGPCGAGDGADVA